MNYKNACKNLGIINNQDITLEILKKKYKFYALKHHPDKNNDINSCSKFQEIKESYDYLLKHLNLYEVMNDENENCDFKEFCNNSSYNNDFFENINKENYNWILFSFLKNIINNDNQNHLLQMIIHKIASICENKAYELLEKIDKKILIKILEIIQKYNEAFQFSSDFLNKIENIINNKIKNDECIILNPLIDDLLENNLYKLTVRGLTYIVPLWHHELLYDNCGNDIYIKCFPILPENIEIDNHNNIHIHLKYNIKEIWNIDEINYWLGKKKLTIHKNHLKLTKNQKIIISNEGISKINTSEIYDISIKSDIVLNIELDL